jgi:hypothetical protein
MRAFVLGTGRCGTNTFANACQKSITNYTVGHETRARIVRGRLDYPDNHIEVDHRLAFFTGSLYTRYPDAIYVHLMRRPSKVIKSWAARSKIPGGFMSAFANGLIFRPKKVNWEESAALMVFTVVDNINFLLDHVEKKVWIDIDQPLPEFYLFWDYIGAKGSKEKAVKALKEVHNGQGNTRVKVGEKLM